MDNYYSIAKKIMDGYYDGKLNIEATLTSDVAIIITYISGSKIQKDYYWKDGDKNTFIERT